MLNVQIPSPRSPGLRAVIAAVAINLVSVLPLFLTGAMAVQISRDIGASATSVGMMASMFAFATMAGSAPLGRMVGRWGVRRSMRASALAAALALLAGAASTSLWWLGAALFLGGIGNALSQPAGNALVAAQLSARHFGIGFAIKQSGIPVATLLGGLSVPLIALTLGWQAAYLAAAALALVAIPLIPADREVTPGRAEAAVPRKLVVPLWGLALGASAAVVAATSIGALGAAGGVAAGLPEATAGYLVALGGLAGLIVRLSAGTAADRFSFDALHGVALLCVLGAVGWALMAIGEPVMFAIGLVVANAFGWGWPGLQHLAVARRFPTATAAASGVSQTGVAVGLLVGPALLGATAGGFGWTWTWLLAACAAVVGAVAVTFAARRIPQPQEVAHSALARRAAS